MKISIIIPTYNEAPTIARLISYLLEHGKNTIADLIVSDGGSSDDTVELANRAGARALVSPGKGRSAQMNYGAAISKGEILYFIHADSFPPETYVDDILDAVQKGYAIGRYRTRFDSSKFILKINAWFTRFDWFICMGGDQTLFVTREIFQQCNGFKEEMKIMEEYDFCERARKLGNYKILRGSALISARKYDSNSWLRVQLANSKIVRMYKKGASQEQLVDTYKRMLSYRKNAF
jgi:rSAM/selenodomain-associated transferase 2